MAGRLSCGAQPTVQPLGAAGSAAPPATCSNRQGARHCPCNRKCPDQVRRTPPATGPHHRMPWASQCTAAAGCMQQSFAARARRKRERSRCCWRYAFQDRATTTTPHTHDKEPWISLETSDARYWYTYTWAPSSAGSRNINVRSKTRGGEAQGAPCRPGALRPARGMGAAPDPPACQLGRGAAGAAMHAHDASQKNSSAAT